MRAMGKVVSENALRARLAMRSHRAKVWHGLRSAQLFDKALCPVSLQKKQLENGGFKSLRRLGLKLEKDKCDSAKKLQQEFSRNRDHAQAAILPLVWIESARNTSVAMKLHTLAFT